MTFPTEDAEILYNLSLRLSDILEFGPGLSTYAFIKAGCSNIITCEHSPKWYDVAVDRFQNYPHIQVLSYENRPLIKLSLPIQRFDLAFVDAPVGANNRKRIKHSGQENCSRWNTLFFSMQHSDTVVLHDAKREDEQNSLTRARNLGWEIKVFDTKRGLALLTKKN